jgi:hypothetical protein
MSGRLKLTWLLAMGALSLPLVAQADTPPTHRVHKVKKQPLPPLPSGARGPVPQIPLDAIPAVAPQINYQNGLLTIVAPNSTLGDILRGVRKQTAADIDIPPAANERVATRLGPGPAREIVAELLNGSHFNYVLLGSPENANQLVRVVLVAKTPDTPTPQNHVANGAPPPPADAAAEPEPEPVADEAPEEPPQDQGTADAEQQPPADQPGVKTPQQMLQEMQQRQLMMQQQQQTGQQPAYPPPGAAPRPGQPPQEQQ